jgi:circadian clock protein KaiC
MITNEISVTAALEVLQKCPTGIKGLDEITGGGLPQGRPTLVCGGAGCGKTLLAMEFLVRGATEFGEPGVYMSVEEKAEELTKNFASLGFDLGNLVAGKMLELDDVHIEQGEIVATGDYDLEGIFVRLGCAIDTIGAKRVVLDTIEVLFSGIPNEVILRGELKRLFSFLKAKNVTAVITGEQGERTLTRFGLEEYVADCVISLSHKVDQQTATRRMRIVKYRGSAHGTSEYPFLIDGKKGFSVMPLSSIGLEHAASDERVSSGISRLDTMLGKKGFYRGSSILVSGNAGSGKSSMAAHFVDAACRRGERCLYFAFEESSKQIIRNMRSIGIDLEQWVNDGLLKFYNSRPSQHGMEMHLVSMHDAIENFNPAIFVADPISNLVGVGSEIEIKSMFSRLIDFLKMKGVTAFYTELNNTGIQDSADVGTSSLMDSWILLQMIEESGERNRGLYILKSRGMNHSNQIREFRLTDSGAILQDVYVGNSGVLTGTSRLVQEAKEKSQIEERKLDLERKQRLIVRKKALIAAQILALNVELESETDDLELSIAKEKLYQGIVIGDAVAMSLSRKSDVITPESEIFETAGMGLTND